MPMFRDRMLQRTSQFALRIVKLSLALGEDKGMVRYVLSRQLLRCGTSVGANYRSACHAKSRTDFLAKIKLCEEEADECEYWLELLVAAGLIGENRVRALRAEIHELACVLATAAKTTRERT